MNTYRQLKHYLYTAYVYIMGRRCFEMRTRVRLIYMTALMAAIVDSLWTFSLLIYRRGSFESAIRTNVHIFVG